MINTKYTTQYMNKYIIVSSTNSVFECQLKSSKHICRLRFLLQPRRFLFPTMMERHVQDEWVWDGEEEEGGGGGFVAHMLSFHALWAL